MTAHRSSSSSSNGSSSRRIWEVGTRDVVVVDEFLENGDGLVRIGGGQGLSIVELLLSKHHLSEVRFQYRSSGGIPTQVIILLLLVGFTQKNLKGSWVKERRRRKERRKRSPRKCHSHVTKN